MSWILPYVPLIGLGLSAAGSAIKGNQEQSQAEDQLSLNRDALKQKAAVDAAIFARQNPGVQMGNSVRGDILSNVQPVTSTGTGRDLKLSGGLSPALLSDNSRQLGALTSRQALLSALGQQDSSGNIGGIPNPYRPPNFNDEAISRAAAPSAKYIPKVVR